MMFKGLDKDGDEKISKDELKAAGLEDPETWMKKHDKDGDNHWNYKEFLEFYKEINETKEKKKRNLNDTISTFSPNFEVEREII